MTTMGAMDAAAWAELLLVTAGKGAVLLALTTGVAILLTRASAAARHWVWFLGMMGLLALPLAERIAPRVEVAIAPVVPRAVDPELAPRAVASDGWSSPAPLSTAELAQASLESWVEARPEPLATSELLAPDAPAADTRFDGVDWAAALVMVWGLGTAVLLAAIGVSLLAVARMERRTLPFPEGRATAMAHRMAREIGIQGPVRLLEGDVDAMPMSWGLLRPVVLLPEGAERWHDTELAAVLLHELAHVRRRDCLTQTLAEVALALHWPNPLVWLAARRLRVEREHACDDRVLVAGARASDYAAQLLALARSFHPLPGSALAAVAMARPVRLGGRLRAVLEEKRSRSLGRPAAALAGAGALVALLGLAAVTPAAGVDVVDPELDEDVEVVVEDEPAPARALPNLVEIARAARPKYLAPLFGLEPASQSVSCGLRDGDWQQSRHSDDGDEHRLTWSRPGCEVQVRIDGDVEFTADFQDVARLSSRALLRIEEDDDRTERRLDITAGADGRPLYDYRVDGSARDFDAGARAWYEAMLLQVFRRGGLMAAERVAAMVRSGGPQAVMQELDELESDHVFASYVQELLEQADVTEGQAVQLIERAVGRVDSDHYMAVVLESVAARHLRSDRVLEAFIAASGTLESDHYRATVLSQALDRGELAPARVEALLESAAALESDHYVSEVLRGVASRYALEPELRRPYLRAVESIESDHYRTEVLSSLLSNDDLDAAELAVVLRAAAGIESDHYVTEVLKYVAEMDLDSDELRGAYLDVTGRIESDQYRSQALGYLLAREDLSPAHLREVIQAAPAIGSDHYRAELLAHIARRFTLEGATRDAFMDALATIESSHYRGTVSDVLLRGERRRD